MSIRLKLALAFLFLAAAALAPSLWINGALRAAATQQLGKDLHHTLAFLDHRIENLRTAASTQARAWLNQPEFFGALSTGNTRDASFGLATQNDDRQALQHAHDAAFSADLPSLKGAQTAIFALLNRNGEVLYDDAAPRRPPGDSLRSLPEIEKALRGNSSFGLWSCATMRAMKVPLLKEHRRKVAGGGCDVVMVVAQPIIKQDGVLGVVLVGRSVLQSVLPDLQELARGMVAIEAQDGKLVASDPKMNALASMVSPSGKAGLVALGAEPYLAAKAALTVGGEVAGQVVLVRALGPQIRAVRHEFWKRLGPAAIVFLIIALALAWEFPRRLAQPLVRLEAAAREVRQGNLDVSVPASGTDEVGRLTHTFNEMVAGLRQRDQIKGLFKRYLNPEVVEELIRHPEKASPGGERRELTVFFVDLVGFTAASEGLSPHALFTILNRYFDEATRALAHHGATIDKFIGDAIMCFWNAPLLDPGHAGRACLAALELLEVVDRLAPELETMGFPSFDCRIGINTGPCLVGNVGSANAQQDFTAVGDAVNLASRLEGAAKIYGTRTLISEDTVRAAGGAASVRELDRVRVKGRSLPVRIYELISPAWNPKPPHLADYAEGLSLYREGAFEQAQARFARHPKDGPSRLFVQRCEQMRETAPPKDWDGVHTLLSK